MKLLPLEMNITTLLILDVSWRVIEDEFILEILFKLLHCCQYAVYLLGLRLFQQGR